MVHFFFLLNTIHCNALTMYAIKHCKPLGKISAFDIGWDLFMSLVKSFIEIRPLLVWELVYVAKFLILFGEMSMKMLKVKLMSNLGLGKQCNGVIFAYYIFLDKMKKEKKDPMKNMKPIYQKCSKPVCENHSKLVCETHLS